MNRHNILCIITAANVLVAAGFSIVGIIAPHEIIQSRNLDDPAVTLFASYAAARAIPLAMMVIVAIFRKSSESFLLPLAILAACIQVMDGLIGVLFHEPGKSFGPFILAFLTFASVYFLMRSNK